MRAMKNAASAPKGHVGSAVMLNAKLKAGMTMMQVITLTRSLGERVRENPETWAWADDGASRVTSCLCNGRAVDGNVGRKAAELSKHRRTHTGRINRGQVLWKGTLGSIQPRLDTVEVADQVTVERALVEVELVDQARAPARLDPHAQAQVVATLLLQQALDLRGRHVGEDDTVGGSLGLGRGGLGGGSVRLDTHVQSFTSWSMGLE